MRISVLGAGAVGTTLAAALSQAGHDVSLGSRSPDSESLRGWAAAHPGSSTGSYADVVVAPDVVINATPGLSSLEVLTALAPRLAGAVIWDVANPLRFDGGVTVVHRDGLSLGEQLQEALPDHAVVKALNTVNTSVMVDPAALGVDHQVFLCGNDDAAKNTVAALLRDLGWTVGQLVDLGDITAARGTEEYLVLWARLMATLGTPQFNIQVVRP